MTEGDHVTNQPFTHQNERCVRVNGLILRGVLAASLVLPHGLVESGEPVLLGDLDTRAATSATSFESLVPVAECPVSRVRAPAPETTLA